MSASEARPLPCFSPRDKPVLWGPRLHLQGLVIWDQQFPLSSHLGKWFTSCPQSPLSTTGQSSPSPSTLLWTRTLKLLRGALRVLSFLLGWGGPGGWRRGQVCITDLSIMREKDAGRYYRGLKRCFKNFLRKKSYKVFYTGSWCN